MEDKVFCKDCKYIFFDDSPVLLNLRAEDTIKVDEKWYRIRCKYPKNMKEVDTSNFYKQSSEYVYTKEPNKINKNNDCPFFEDEMDQYKYPTFKKYR